MSVSAIFLNSGSICAMPFAGICSTRVRDGLPA